MINVKNYLLHFTPAGVKCNEINGGRFKIFKRSE
jgi:hypothetical protein